MPSEVTTRRYVPSYTGVSIDIESDGSKYETTNTYKYPRVLQDSVIKGGPLRNWRLLIAEGNNACTDLFGTKFDVNASFTNLYWQRQRIRSSGLPLFGRAEIYGDGVIRPPAPDGNPVFDSTEARNEAIRKFVARTRSENTRLKGLVVAGELGQTLRMILSPAKSLRRAVSEYLTYVMKRGPRISKRRRTKFVRDTWLEYSFGMRPLISDIESGMEALTHSRSARRMFTPVSSTGTGSGRSFVGSGSQLIGSNDASWEIWLEETWLFKYFGIVHSECSNPVYFNAKNFGFRPDEFVPTLWELIPFSFLADYFTNIGDVINAWSYRNHDSRFVNHMSRLEQRNFSTNHIVPRGRSRDLNYDYVWGGSLGPVEVKRTSVSRLSNVELDLPSFQFQIPGMGTKWVNIAALSVLLSRAQTRLAR